MAAILVICGLAVLTSCSREDDPVESDRQEYTGVPLVILDTDLGSSTDDLFALEMLHRYEQEGRCRLLIVEGFTAQDYVLPLLRVEGNYHTREIWLYRDQLRENMALRVSRMEH